MTERHLFEVGEIRYIWLDANDERTSPFHKTIPAAYGYRTILERHLNGQIGWTRKPFEPKGTGRQPARLAKVAMEPVEVELDDDEQLDVAAAERLAASKTRSRA